MSPAQGHAFVEHTGEVALEVHASTRRALFEEAALALAQLWAGELPPVPEGAGERFQVRARDPEGLLVDFLNELIFLSDVRKQVFPRVEVEALTPTGLSAWAHGASVAAVKTAVKAATYHGLCVREADGGFFARVVLDV